MLKTTKRTAFLRLALGATIALGALLTSPPPAAAQDIDLLGYYEFSYEPVTFDQGVIQGVVRGSDVFYLTVRASAVCTEDFPLAVGSAELTATVVAEPAAGGEELTLHEGYTLTIDPFPSQQGQSTEIDKTVPLRFPPGSGPGEYEIVSVIVEASVKVGILPVSIAGFLPERQPMGTLTYAAPYTALPTPATTTTTATTSVAATTPADGAGETDFGKWGNWVIIAEVIAGGTIVLLIVLRVFRRRRR